MTQGAGHRQRAIRDLPGPARVPEDLPAVSVGHAERANDQLPSDQTTRVMVLPTQMVHRTISAGQASCNWKYERMTPRRDILGNRKNKGRIALQSSEISGKPKP